MKLKSRLIPVLISAIFVVSCTSNGTSSSSGSKIRDIPNQNIASLDELNAQAMLLSITGKSSEAIAQLKLISDQGHSGAMVQLGLIYEFGTGVPKDYSEAAKWYRKASNLGDADAQNQLGMLYEHGKGVPKYPQIAFSLYSKSSAQDNEIAQLNLARLYYSGIGTLKDQVKSYEETKKSAKQGFAPAQGLLSLLYEAGMGTEIDLIEAYAWASLYSVQKGDISTRNEIEKKMSKEEISLAEKKAQNYYNKNFE